MKVDNSRAALPVGFRPVIDSDFPFLEALYASTREDIAALSWSAEDKQQLMSMQFRAQHEHYRRSFPRAQFDIILWQDRPVGRLYVDRTSEEHRLIDITLLPDSRGRGLGSAVIEALLEEAARARKSVRLRVEPHNPAARLYQRLGFRTIANEQLNWHMECRPAGS
ncbi:MAG: GNAT family N-acetyltransferase [Acidobacteriota bacterium]|nr:GNAT family N-acetyltransferase [Acidobacteriota bacterium]